MREKLEYAAAAVACMAMFTGMIAITILTIAGVDIREVFSKRQYETLDCMELAPPPGPIVSDFIGVLLSQDSTIFRYFSDVPPPAIVADNNGEAPPHLSLVVPAGE